MASSITSPKHVKFGVFELDVQDAELRKSGVKVKLQEQPLKILQTLLEKHGEIVTREELRGRIWPANTFVEFDQGLYNAMARLRDALGDASENPRFIQTVARRGYKFIAPVTLTGGESSSEVNPKTDSSTWLWVHRWTSGVLAGLLGGALFLVVVFGFDVAGARGWLRTRTPPIRSLAVLPLQNLSNDPQQDYFADGMTDELITELAQVSNLRVISRTSTMSYKGTKKTLPQIGRELNADAVVEGTVERFGSRMRIRVQLVQAESDRHLWARSYDRDLQDALLLQSQAAGDIVHEIQASLTPAQQQQLASARKVDPEAHEDYLKGLYFSNKRAVPDFNRSIEYYQQAIAKDRNYAPAYAGLAESYIGLYVYHVSPENSRANATQAALRSAELDPNLAEAHLEVATVREFFDWDWPEAEREYRRATELNPNSAFAHLAYALFLSFQGRVEEGLSEAQRSQDLDPVSPFIRTAYCLDLNVARRYDQAIQKCREALELDPNFVRAHGNLQVAYEAKGLYEAAIEQYEKAAALRGESPAEIADVRRAFSQSGITGARRKRLQQRLSGGEADPYGVAKAYAGLKETDLAFKWLDKACEQRSAFVEGIKVEPMFDDMRSDARYKDLLRRLHLDN